MKAKLRLCGYVGVFLSICGADGLAEPGDITLEVPEGGQIQAKSDGVSATAAVAMPNQKDFICGPDVTEQTYKLLSKIIDDFDDPGMTSEQRNSACWNLLHPRQGAVAWDIYPLFGEGKEIHAIAPRCARPRGEGREFQCERTISFEYRCVHGGTSNYLFWGIVARLCDDPDIRSTSEQALGVAFPFVAAITPSRAKALARWAYNSINYSYPDGHPTPKAQELFIELGAAYVEYHRAEVKTKNPGASPEGWDNWDAKLQRLEDVTPAWNNTKQQFKSEMSRLERDEKVCRLACFLSKDKSDALARTFDYKWDGVTNDTVTEWTTQDLSVILGAIRRN